MMLCNNQADGGAIMITRMTLMIIRMREMAAVAIKLTAMMMKVLMMEVEEEDEEVVTCLFPICPTFCEALTHSSAVAIVSGSFEGFVCCGGLCVFSPPPPPHPPTLFNLLPLIGPHQSLKSCALWGLGPLTLNMWFCGSGHRHLLTHSVQIRHRLQLGISETIVTNKKLVAEWKLCILSQWSCRNITIPDKFLGRVLAAWMGAPSFHADTK